METILKTDRLNKVYRLGSLIHRVRIDALDDVNLDIKSDRPIIIGLVGESGSGKTTFAKIILRLVEPTSGRAIVYDRLVAGKGDRPTGQELFHIVQPIFQDPYAAFSSYQTVNSYLERTAVRVNQLSRAEAVDVVEEALTSVGLKYEDVRGKYANQFSGGELQRASVARALIPRPKMIIADEPVSMIDASLRMSIINLFLTLKQEYNTSFLYITHDLTIAYYVCDYIAILYRGTIFESGPAKAVLTDPQHPYTKLLLDSVPLINRKWDQKQIAMSDIETEEYQFEGCKFRNRCSLAREICAQSRPSAVRQGDGWVVYCHFV